VGLPVLEALQSRETELQWSGDTPVLPSICPTIIVAGTSFEMGEQYARQSIEIFGRFVFEEYAKRRFSLEEYTQLQRWEAELLAYAPEIAEMAEGLAQGASDAGVPMRYENALVLWTTCLAPAQAPAAMMDSASALFAAAYAGLSSSRPAPPATESVELPVDKCSGAAAWGNATVDGDLYFGATQDHDAWFQATIVAYPDEGNAFVFTPFSVSGFLPGMGLTSMAGLPGFNSKGYSIVHHGGDPKMVEPPASWGYGIRKGAAMFHLLRYADTAAAARELEQSWPVGDVGRMMGSPGVFAADAEGAYVFECRGETPGATLLRDRFPGDSAIDALYVTNNAMHPEAGRANGGADTPLAFSDEGGWHTLDPKIIAQGMTIQDKFARWASKISESRNRFLRSKLAAGAGRITLDWFYELYRTPGPYPEEQDYEVAMAAYRTGGQIDAAAGHRGNALTVICAPSPKAASYSVCVGPALRSLPPRDHSHGFYYYDETAAFWTLRLLATPAAVCRDSLELADALVAEATAKWGACARAGLARSVPQGWLDQARSACAESHRLLADQSVNTTLPIGDECARTARALRQALRAQVRARQVLDVLHPPGCLAA
jgi:hypothetical protein